MAPVLSKVAVPDGQDLLQAQIEDMVIERARITEQKVLMRFDSVVDILGTFRLAAKAYLHTRFWVGFEDTPYAIHKKFVRNILRQYSCKGISLDFFEKPDTFGMACNAKKRDWIENWLDKIETPNDKNEGKVFKPLDSNYNLVELRSEEDVIECYPWGSKEGPMIDWTYLGVEMPRRLPPAEDFPETRPVGFYTEMSGLTDVSISSDSA
jgi:hypothetical protein